MHSVRERRTLLAEARPSGPSRSSSFPRRLAAAFFIRSRRELVARTTKEIPPSVIFAGDLVRIVPDAYLGDYDATSARGSIFTYLFHLGEMKRK